LGVGNWQLMKVFIPKTKWPAILAVIGLAVAPRTVVRAQDWNRFRGSNGQGLANRLPNAPSFIDQPIKWKIRLPGVGHSSPVVWANRVYVTSADQETGVRYVLSFNTNDGSEVWRREFSGNVFKQHEFNSFASSTPAVDENLLYIVWAAPDALSVVALNHRGEDVWNTGLGEFESRHGHGVSPMVCDDLVIVPCDQDYAPSFVAALNRNSGDIVWKVDRQFAKLEQDAAYATPCIYESSEGKRQLITFCRPDGISALEPSTGQTLWQYPAFPYRPVGSPVITRDGLIVGGNPTTIAVRPPSSTETNAQEVFRIEGVSPYIPTLLAIDDFVFLWADRGIVECIDSATGKRHWKKRVGGEFHSSPIAVGRAVYCVSTDGELVALSASEEFRELGRRKLEEDCSATPAVTGQSMLVRTANSLICIGGGSDSVEVPTTLATPTKGLK
jgi:outer membrane protein assembly factor BamB